MQPLSSLTFRDPAVMQNPYPYYERMRTEDPVHFDEGIRTWLITRYEDLVAVARNTEVVGLPMDRVDEISRGADSMVAQFGAGASREEAYQHARNVLQLQRFTREAIEQRRAKPGQDLISQIVHARIDDPNSPQLTDREVLSISTVAIAGGVDTTRNGIAFGLHALATQSGLLQRLRQSTQQDKDLARFADETLRYYAPVPQLPRITTQETVLRGKTIPKNAFVMMCWASGNRDPQRFADPDRFDIDRPNLNYHVAFGTGVHHCLGAMLARQEMKCAFREIVNNIDSVELAVPQDKLDLSTTMVILRSLASLPVHLHRRIA